MPKGYKLLIFIGVAFFFLCFVSYFSGLTAALAKGNISLGRQDYAQGRYAEAAHRYKIARLLGYYNEQELAAALYHLGKFEEAERILRRANAEPGTLVALGVVLMAQGKDVEAERILRSVLDRASDHDHPEILAAYNLSLLYRKRGDKLRAQQAYRDAIAWSNGGAAKWTGPQPIYQINYGTRK